VPVAHLGDALFPILVFELFDGPTLQAHYANPRYAEGVRSTTKQREGVLASSTGSCAVPFAIAHIFLVLSLCIFFSLFSV
jgi:hypothetical protein